MRRKTKKKEVAFRNNIIAFEKLPYPLVLYPGFYGAFFGFRQKENMSITLCSCSREAITNYIKFRLAKGIPRNASPHRMFILDSMYFPISLVDQLMKLNLRQDETLINNISFENKLCHECNKIIPSYSYCHPMYGGAFKQNYGWYINKQALEYGVEPISTCIIKEACPDDILEIAELCPSKTSLEIQRLKENNNAELLIIKLREQNRKIWNIIENEVRRKFGHKKVGEAWSSETILFYIIQTIFSKLTILRHYRPSFLKGLEIDIFISDLKIGIEYQGIQHFKPVDYWGGAEALKKLKQRDIQKKAICEKEGIKLIYFYHDEGLSNELVIQKLKSNGISV